MSSWTWANASHHLRITDASGRLVHDVELGVEAPYVEHLGYDRRNLHR